MKKTILGLSIILTAAISSCDRVAPNYVGVLMENYGKAGKADFSLVKGRVNTMGPGTELFQVPLWEQRAGFDADLTLKASDNTEFKCHPTYSYTVIEQRAIDVVFENKQLNHSDSFMHQLEDNILEMKIRDIIKEESRRYTTDTLMAPGGSLRFERDVEDKVRTAFDEKGLKLGAFSAQLEFTDKVREKIDSRNEVNTNISVLEQQITEQKKRNELAALKAEEQKILSSGLTPQILQHEFYEAWKVTKQPIYGSIPYMKMIQ
jgi:hypothetical protein